MTMGTVVLRSQDCLRDRFHHEALTLNQRIRPRKNLNPVNTCLNPNFRNSRRRKWSPVSVQATQEERSKTRCGDRSTVMKVPSTNLVTGGVKILKHGEKLIEENHPDSKTKTKCEEGYNLGLGSTNRLGSDPEIALKQIRVSRVSECKVVDGVYAGSAFFTSPPPSSLPVPRFLGKNGAATNDLKRILRLNLL